MNTTRVEKLVLKDRRGKIRDSFDAFEEVEMAIREWLRNLKYIHCNGIFFNS